MRKPAPIKIRVIRVAYRGFVATPAMKPVIAAKGVVGTGPISQSAGQLSAVSPASQIPLPQTVIDEGGLISIVTDLEPTVFSSDVAVKSKVLVPCSPAGIVMVAR